jgi:choline dehydrogenase-like flavoprotein
MNAPNRIQVLVIGSGAGGSVTALELARRGFQVTVLEEGGRHTLEDYGDRAPEAMKRLYRWRGMTPIMGPVPIGYVEGKCVGGSTEINSGFWHRTPPEILLRWRAQYDLEAAGPDELAPHFQWSESLLGVGPSRLPWPKSTRVMAKGADALGWACHEVPRMAPGCEHTNACAHGCPKGNKQGMSVSLIPLAERAGVRVIPNCRARLLMRDRGRVDAVLASLTRPDGSADIVRIDAEHVFVCAGPTESPALLRRSGAKLHVGDSLRIHPMLKVAAKFPEEINAHESVLPLLQVKEFAHDISLGGAFVTPGHLSMILSENWKENRRQMGNFRHMAAYYVAVRGTGRGTIRPSFSRDDRTTIRYTLSFEDVKHLSQGLARLSALLLAAGADAVYPSVHGIGPIRTQVEAIRWMDELLPRAALSLTTVHAFSACPAGERPQKCAVDSFGKVAGFQNLYVNDASIIPDSPGVNPQGTVMALARRNAIRFAERIAS